jgi:hypothetical protein
MQLCVLNLDYFVFQFGINCKMIYYLCNIITAKLKKLFRIFLFFMMIACTTKLQASSCIPAYTTVTLTRQSEVDSFPINFPGCDVVEGNLVISGNDIVNLNGLNVISKADNIAISYNSVLNNLNGLGRLDTVNYLTINNNPLLISLIGLNSIDYIFALKINENPLITNLHGLDSLIYLDYCDITYNDNLIDFSGLEGIKHLNQSIYIAYNNSLKNFNGLQNIVRLNGSLLISHNNSLMNCAGLESLKYTSSLTLFENNSIENFQGLKNLDTITYKLSIEFNYSIKNLEGLENIKYIGDGIRISDNPNLCNINQLNKNLVLDYNIIEIFNNPKLSCCKIMDTIFSNNINSTLTSIYITNNAPGCNDTTEIRTITTQNCCSTKYTLLKDTICNGEQVIFNSQILKNTGTYYDTFVSNGNDSIVILELIVFNKSYQIKTLNFCIGQSFTLSNGRTITATGIYKDTIPNFCDSIIEYRLNFLNNIIVNQNATICQGKTYTLPKGNIVQTTGIYKDTLRSTFNCDSIVITNLTITKPIPFVNNVTICKGKNYVLPNGNSVNNAGTYYDTIRKPNTCDSIVITNLTVTKPIPFVNNATICKGKNYILPNGNSVNNTGTYYDTIRKPNTCDSIVITNLSVTKPIPFVNNVSICKGKNYVLPNGNSVNNAGTYYDTIRKPNTCDSIVITNLIVNPYLQSSQTATTCLGKTYTLPSGKTVTQSGIYKDTIKLHLVAIVLLPQILASPIQHQHKNQILFVKEKFTHLPSGKQVTNTGIYIDTIKQTNTCDSVIITNLSVFQNTFSVTLKSIDTLDAGNAIELKPMYSNQSAISWNWSPTTNLNCTTCEKPIATPSQNTQYSLKATAQNGCDDTAKTTIIVRQTEVYIPTAFSPNNDGINDDLTVFVNNPVAFHLVIFNRYDQKFLKV